MDHLQFAHLSWSHHLKERAPQNPVLVDATTGNGHDTLQLAKLANSFPSGRVYAIDIQEKAILSTRSLLEKELTPGELAQIDLQRASHAPLPSHIPPADLIVYNLGYLPGGDKSCTTMPESTLESLKSALERLKREGLLSITLYPGHKEGAEEKAQILAFLSSFTENELKIYHFERVNRPNAPSVILLRKREP